MGTEFLKIMDSEEVREVIDNIKIKMEIEQVSLENAYRRVIAEDINAEINLPPFNKSLMDGYAVRAEDTFGASEENPVILKLTETVKAGDSTTRKVEQGECIGINTGAPVPDGANGIVMVEYTENKNGNIHIFESASHNQNIVFMGSDISKNDLILKSGTLLTHDKIGVLGALGIDIVKIFKKPEIAVISTGDELVKPGEELEYGKIYDINSLTIFNAVKTCGCTPVYSGVAKDNFKDLKKKFKQHLNADVIITSGGTSAGTGDVLKDVLDDMGQVLVHGIAVKPGKPTIVGIIENKPVFGLPGNPAAALMIFHVFVTPFLKKMACMPDNRQYETKKIKISRRFHSARGRHQYVFVKIEDDVAYPILKDSGAITAVSEADGYFEVPKNVEIVEEGSEIEVNPLEIV